MNQPILFAMPGNDALARDLAAALPADTGTLQVRRFPDGESYVRFDADVAGRHVILACTLDRPDEKMLQLYFAACTARECGAASVGLVAPYLAYMRQDAVFNPGEGVTSAQFARWLSGFVDWMVTVDPHLHRHRSLDEIYTIPTRVVQAAPAIAAWVREQVERPVIIGPDEESEQWVAHVARLAGCGHEVLRKVRHGDREVEVSVPRAELLRERTPVLVDDIASTASTMIAAVKHLHAAGLPPPVCVAVHPIFAGDGLRDLEAAGVARVASCATMEHPTNAISVTAPVVAAIRELLPSVLT
ncbi:MAG: ribose-phosphate pyrophosphokinase [Telluria sp.]